MFDLDGKTYHRLATSLKASSSFDELEGFEGQLAALKAFFMLKKQPVPASFPSEAPRSCVEQLCCFDRARMTHPKELYFSVVQTPFGNALFVVSDMAIYELRFLEQGGDVDKCINAVMARWPESKLEEDRERISAWRDRIFLHHEKVVACVFGSALQCAAWAALLKVPYGHVISYQLLAEEAGAPKAHRAVATAIGQNPISWLLPCHRIIKKNGEVGQYGGGSLRKRILLAYEALTI